MSSPRSRLPTLSGRVSVLALVVIAGWLIVLAVGFDVVLSARLDQQVIDTVRVRAQAASATVRVRGGVPVGLHESATDSELDEGIWLYAGTRAVERPRAPAAMQSVADRIVASGVTYADAHDRRFYVLKLRRNGKQIGTLVASIDTEPYAKTKDTAIIGSVVVAALLVVGAFPVLRLATARALRPVARMTRQAADWSVVAPAQRFGGPQKYAELAILAGTLDELLDRLAAVLRHERQLSAELSHELRTPLARMIGELDLMLTQSGAEQAPALEKLRADAVAMDAIMDALLAAARAELVRTVGRSDLDPILAGFAARGDGLRVEAKPSGLSVGIDADVVGRILSPIIENARRYARSLIGLSARRDGSNVLVEIENDGPRLATQLAERVFEPGFRAPEPDCDEGGGAGLGLPLARRIARAADGDVVVDPDAARTRFLVRLPSG